MESSGSQAEITATIATSHFVIIEVEYRAGTTAVPHGHGLPSLTFAVSGEFHEIAGGQSFPCDDATVLISESSRQHTVVFRCDTKCLVITTVRPETFDLGILLRAGPRIRRSTLKPLLRNVWHESHRNDAASRLALDGAVFMLLAELMRVSQSRTRCPLSRSLKLLHDTSGMNVSNADLARVSGMSIYAFARQFKLETGCTIGAYRRRLRIERAKELLRTTRKAIRDVALELEFSDPGHFSRTFTRYAGMPPGAYRRAHQ